MIKNKHKVPRTLWKTFRNEKSRGVFNDLMDFMTKNQNLCTHPKMGKVSKAHWYTICWNASCSAAWAVAKHELPKKGDVMIDIDPKTKRELKKRKVK